MKIYRVTLDSGDHTYFSTEELAEYAVQQEADRGRIYAFWDEIDVAEAIPWTD